MLTDTAHSSEISPARRLAEYLDLVRELSTTRDPQALIESYRARARFVIPSDAAVSISRKGLSNGAVRITRSSWWETPINPWKEPHRLPVVESGLLCELMAAGEPALIDDLRVDPADPFAEHARGMRSLAASPVYDDGDVNYMVMIMRREPAAFHTDELATLVLTTNLIGKATSHLILSAELERAYAALDREFRAVGALQRELLPKSLPDIPGVRFAVHYETSTRAGGDYYDFFPVADGSWGILIADVSGHGAAAAVIVAMIHTMMKLPMYMCPQEMPSPVQGLRFLNRELLRSTNGSQFVTAWLGVFDPRSRVLRYANAGHNPPRWLRAVDRRVIPMESGDGMPLAIDAGFDSSELNVKLSRGDRLLLYTDGITETFNARHEMFGTEGLDAVLDCCSRTPEGLIASVRDAVTAFSGGAPAADDRTLVAMALD